MLGFIWPIRSMETFLPKYGIRGLKANNGIHSWKGCENAHKNKNLSNKPC